VKNFELGFQIDFNESLVNESLSNYVPITWKAQLEMKIFTQFLFCPYNPFQLTNRINVKGGVREKKDTVLFRNIVDCAE
jgi:hypothetical protein